MAPMISKATDRGLFMPVLTPARTLWFVRNRKFPGEPAPAARVARPVRSGNFQYHPGLQVGFVLHDVPIGRVNVAPFRPVVVILQSQLGKGVTGANGVS